MPQAGRSNGEKRGRTKPYMLDFYFKGHSGRSEWVAGQAGGQEGIRRATPVGKETT